MLSVLQTSVNLECGVGFILGKYTEVESSGTERFVEFCRVFLAVYGELRTFTLNLDEVDGVVCLAERFDGSPVDAVVADSIVAKRAVSLSALVQDAHVVVEELERAATTVVFGECVDVHTCQFVAPVGKHLMQQT